ncbi:MAG: nucleotidyl transferase AbiEii/AbiGii toxin family protein, partial [Candidatus Eisenbacteria sp.]|nr:nucleotidyl transferase AbiEii/AbiGii toxin family protein [Candidatus Eisenbacteria bacterium]
MARNVTDIVASVHQRVLNSARDTGRPFNELLQHFAIERFLYRLSKSRHADRFILKGALMLSVWSGATSCPTKDIDLLGRIDNNLEAVTAAMKDVCETDVEADGMIFEGDSVTAARITEDAEYQGVRVRLKAALGNARVSMQVDVGIGDVVFPRPQDVEYPALLDFPPARLKGYAMESTIAEKFHAMVILGVLNSRMKDF